MKKKIVIIMLLILFTSCDSNKYNKYDASFNGPFDTFSTITIYTESKVSFSNYYDLIYNRLNNLHKQFDIYNDYEDINNIKTINDNAGISPVTVSEDIIKLIEFGIEAYKITNGSVNIAMGSILKIWHDYRTEGLLNPDEAELPNMNDLREAALLTNINDVIIDRDNMTVYLAKKGMSLDVGAIAKGFGAQIAADEAMAAGMTTAILNIGGNIITVGTPVNSDRKRWGVGIQNPDIYDESNIFDTVYVTDAAIVSSGNYQRYYVVDGVYYNHIISPETLMPADIYSSVSVISSNSVFADMLSTALFILPINDGQKLLEKYNAEAIWIYSDKTYYTTSGYDSISKNISNYNAYD